MAAPPPSDSGDGGGRLQRCIRDLAALNALPSMCIGRSPEETIDVILDALPTALDCDVIYVQLPGSPPREYGSVRRTPVPEGRLPALRMAAADGAGGDTCLTVGGETFWCSGAEIPLGGERGRLLAGRAAALDPETDRVLIRSAANIVGTTLENANILEMARRKDDFLAILGHELRNPLAPIVTAVELLRRNPTAAREQKIIDRHARHLIRLVDDLLDISRVTRGHVDLRSELVPLASILERAIEMASPLISRQRHALVVTSPDDLNEIALQGDSMRLAQVFGNLLTNAAKFTPSGGRIDVSVERAPGWVRVAVTDNGRGIAADQLRRIFEPFVQADRQQDVLHGGLGLGLAIVKTLVERHAGRISAHSRGRGSGAVFTVDLPVLAFAQVAAAQPDPPSVSAEHAGVRVLLVDDNVDIAELLSDALQQEGFQTAVAHDGRRALETWRQFLPHAAVLDVGLPDCDGYQLARTLRAEYGRDVMLIAATGYGQPKDRSLSAEAGFDCHLVKPVSVQDLVSVLEHRGASDGRCSAPPA